ncbi:hypothetical protein [Robertkochia solimangrovi]|uniref:hypothetical protein n=1 Tax=Robertkochia solimangrovi TaxID=2213046 RepID=UPI00117DD5C5|nr:hypothetical protein [Robertkochia solimangrovi]TRZ41965.1 hypothetical protein DMZ48_15110 [Robertkochia solimangrovi]
MSNREIFIGLETGGSYAGNSSGYSEYVELPDSHITIKIATLNFQIDLTSEEPGHGVLHDYPVSFSLDDYMR